MRQNVVPLSVGWIVVSFIVYKITQIFLTKRKYAAQAKDFGCQEPPAWQGGPILGLQHLKDMQKADTDQLFPNFLIHREEVMSKTLGRHCTTFSFNTLGQTSIFTSDPENIKTVLATKFPDFDLGPARRGNMIRTLGDGIFVQDSKQWEHSRSMLRPQFVREQISDLKLEETHVQHLLLAVGKANHDGWSRKVDIQTLFFRLTLDSATEFLFGQSVDSQLNGISGLKGRTDVADSSFAQHFDSASRHLAKSFRYSDLYWLHNPAEFKNDNKIVNDFAEYYVKLGLEKRRKSVSEKDTNSEKYVFLNAIAESTDDPIEIRAQLLNILLAGRDTTASLLSWFFYEMLRHPDEFHKLRKVIVDTFGTYDQSKDVTFSALKGCQHLQHCLSEVLRLWPLVPLNARKSNKATVLPLGGGLDGKSPVFIPPQTDVTYSPHVMQRREDLWGKDANEFRPDRFVGRKSGWEYLPFNGGPRICIGQQFALTEASYVIVRLLQRYDDISTTPEELSKPALSNVGLTSCPGHVVTLQLHEANA